MTDRLTTRRKMLLGIGTASSVTLAGCSSGDSGDGTTENVPETTDSDMMTTTRQVMTPDPGHRQGQVRVAHMSPNAPNVDVYVDGDGVFEDVAFGTVSEHLTVPAGDPDVTITGAGDPDTEVFSGPVTIAGTRDYTIAATGELGNMANRPFEPLVLEDDNSEVAENMARLRVVHASPDAPAVNVTAAGGEAVLFSGVSYGQSGYAEVEANDYTVEIRGATERTDGEVLDDYDISLNGGTVYTAFAAGYLSPDDEPADAPFDLLVAQDTSN